MAETWTPVGKVTPTPKGAWSSSVSYARLDIVSNDGASYIAIQGVPAGTAITNTSYWQKFADKGDTGATGISVNSIVVTETSVSGSAHNYRMTITMTNGDVTNVDYTVTDGAVTSVNGRTGDVVGLAEQDDLDKAFFDDSVSGAIASFSDSAGLPVKDMTINVEPYQNLNGYDHPWVGGAGVNKYPNCAISGTNSGVTITHNSTDESYKISGVSTEYRGFLALDTFTLKAGTYKLTRTASSSSVSENNLRMEIRSTDGRTTYGNSNSNGGVFTLASDTEVKARIIVGQGNADFGTGITYRFQIEVGSTATAWSPYSNICPIYPATGKNLLPQFTSGTASNLTFTVNDDGSVHVTGTNTGTVFYAVQFTLNKGDYILSGAPKDGQLTIRNALGGGTPSAEFSGTFDDYGSEAHFSVSATASAWLNIRTVAGTWDTTYYPMIRHAEVTSPTYVPQDGLGIVRTGKNLLSQNSIFKGVLNDANLVVGNNNSTVYRTAIIKLPQGSWTFTFPVNVYLVRLVKDGTSTVLTTNNVKTYTINTTTDGWVGISWRDATSSSTNWNDSSVTQLEKGSASTGIEPYTTERYYSRDYNFWDEEWEVGNIDNTTGQNTVSANCIRSKNYIPVEPNTKYYTNAIGSTGIYEIYFYGSDKSFLHEMANTKSFTTSANAHFMRFRCTNAYGTTYKNDIIFNFSNPSQVGYGGVLDVDTGLLTVTHAMRNYDNYTGEITKSANAAIPSGRCVYYINTTDTPWSGGDANPRGIVMKSSIYDIGSNGYTAMVRKTEFAMGIGSYSGAYCMIGFNVDDSLSTVEEFRTWLQSVHCDVWYPLRNEHIYQLTPVQVKTLLGYNNIWTDSGTVEVTYSINMHTMVDRAIADAVNEDTVVGSAEQLLSTQYDTDSVPYAFRKSPYGDREFDEIHGGTIAWNQLVPNNTWNSAQKAFPQGTSFVEGHKLLFYGTWKKIDSEGSALQVHFYNKPTSDPSEYTRVMWENNGGSKVYSLQKSNIANGEVNTDGATWLYLGNMSNQSDIVLNCIDLTQMFGSAIADYLYALDQNTAGAGYAWFKSLFPKPYYAYNAGQLISVSGLSAHKMVGFNAWDEQWEVGGISSATGQNTADTTTIRSKNYVPIIPNTKYYAHNSGITTAAWFPVRYYDADKNYIGDLGADGEHAYWNNNDLHPVITPSNARYMRFVVQTTYGTTYNHDICINLHWDGERDGEYEPYEAHSYALDDSLTLRGVPKLNSANEMYFDGDIYSSNGTVQRRYAVITLNGTETWSGGNAYWYTQANAMKKVGDYKAIMVCSNHVVMTNNYRTDFVDGTITGYYDSGNAYPNQNWIYYKNSSFTSASDVKAYFMANPTTVVYELATPTTESASPYINPQICNEYGTEEYVSAEQSGVTMIVGHNTKYPQNLRKKIEGLPWNFSSLIAPTETTNKATRNYTVGSFLIMNNTLYKVTSAIANGGTITVGTNVTATTIMAEILAL